MAFTTASSPGRVPFRDNLLLKAFLLLFLAAWLVTFIFEPDDELPI